MNLPRKDYGCPLRVWQAATPTGTVHHVMPPRSARAAGRWQALTGEWWTFRLTTGAALVIGSILEDPGPHLGQRIHWNELPPAVQTFLRASVFGEYCPAEGAT
jgi:hypothetical protein